MFWRSCPSCGVEITIMAHLIGHMRDMHGGFGLFRCPWCSAKADGFDSKNIDLSDRWYSKHFSGCTAFLAWALSGVGGGPKGFPQVQFSDNELRIRLEKIGWKP